MLEHFKMYIMITDIVGEKRIDLAYPIWNLDTSKEVAIVNIFSDNTQYQIREPLKVLLITNEEQQLMEGVFMDGELNTSIRRNLITTLLDANVVKTDKLACIMKMVFNLNELDNTDNVEDRRLSKILFRYHVTGFTEFTSFEPVALQYKRLKNVEFTSLDQRIMDQKDHSITDGPGLTIVLHIR